MIGKLLPLLLALLGLGAGIGAGLFLRPAAEAPTAKADASAHAAPGAKTAAANGAAATGHGAPSAPPAKAHGAPAPSHGSAKGDATHEYVKLNNQFIVPIVADGKVASLVIMSVSLEVIPGASTTVYAAEPKLRDAFLQVLFDHANAGGFSGNFTVGTKMQLLRDALKEMAVKVLGPIVTGVLIDDIVRQDT